MAKKSYANVFLTAASLEQHVNGKITYLPAIIAPKGTKPYVKEWTDDGEKV